jgi:hypothetical protein
LSGVALSAVALTACGNGDTSGAGDTADSGVGGNNGGADAGTGSPGDDAGSGNGSDAGTTTGSPKSGVLLYATNAPIAGLSYSAGSQKGTTDAKGTFSYDPGSTVTFTLGAYTFGSAPSAALLTPYQLAASATCEDTDALVRLVSVLQALDGDAMGANGITLPTAAVSASPSPLSTAADADVAAFVGTLAPGHVMPTKTDGLRAFITAFDGEAWTQKTTDTFDLTTALLRGQGVATDGTSWFFSGTTGLERTNDAFSSQKSSAIAIPPALLIAGSDHIGDIDLWNGTLFAPIEDKGYKAPKVVLFDPGSFSSGTVFDIPVSLQSAGVPWIAVDGPRSVAYMAEWDPTPVIHVFALSTMVYQRDITLSRTLGRIQGAKVYKGQLYVSMDDAMKSIVKVHLGSGTVIDLFQIGDSGIEEEGIVMRATADGTLLHTLNVTSSRKASELRHHANTRAPLRWTACK